VAPKRGPDLLRRLLVEHHANRALSGTNDPSGIQWFVEITFDDAQWFCDRTHINTLIDALAAAPWFREFDVFAPEHRPGAPFRTVDDVRELVAAGGSDIAIFAHGDPLMSVNIAETETALALSFTPHRLELRLWFAATSVARYQSLVIGSVATLLFSLKRSWQGAIVSKGLATPDPVDGVRYRRTRPLRIASRALNAIVDVFDRDCAGDVELLPGNTVAIIDAPVPSDVQRHEDGRLVANVWLSDPTDPIAFADACSRHEQWAVPFVRWQLAPGWSELGDLEVIDDPPLVEISSVEALPARAKQRQVVVIGSRDDAVAMRDRTVKAGFARIAYRAADGKLWNPFPPGEWITNE
jgi:hypothetical protein